MKLSIRKYFSKFLTRNVDHYEGFRQYFIMIGSFTAIPSICNQRSLVEPTKAGFKEFVKLGVATSYLSYSATTLADCQIRVSTAKPVQSS